jgi:hypothetical protein
VDADVGAFVVEVTGCNEAVAAVVAAAHKDEDALGADATQALGEGVRDCASGRFHQLRLRDARGESSGLDGAHLSGGDEFHRSPRRTRRSMRMDFSSS